MKSLFIVFLISSGFIFLACPSATPTPPPYGGGNGVGNDTLNVPPDTTLQLENPGPVLGNGNDTTAVSQ